MHKPKVPKVHLSKSLTDDNQTGLSESSEVFSCK